MCNYHLPRRLESSTGLDNLVDHQSRLGPLVVLIGLKPHHVAQQTGSDVQFTLLQSIVDRTISLGLGDTVVNLLIWLMGLCTIISEPSVATLNVIEKERHRKFSLWFEFPLVRETCSFLRDHWDQMSRRMPRALGFVNLLKMGRASYPSEVVFRQPSSAIWVAKSISNSTLQLAYCTFRLKYAVLFDCRFGQDRFFSSGYLMNRGRRLGMTISLYFCLR